MNQSLLLDGIVREAARLIATLATTGNSSVSVGHLPDLFFVTLAKELLDGQGKSQKVTADLFNLPLRTFRYKLKTLPHSASQRGLTLWRVVFDYLSDEAGRSGAVKLVDLENRFSREDPKMLSSIVRDMVQSGLLFQSGTGSAKRYIVAERPTFVSGGTDESDAHLAWVAVYTHPGSTAKELADAMGIGGTVSHQQRLAAALDRLLADGRVVLTDPVEGEVQDDDDDPRRYATAGFNLPDTEDGPFAAVYDHFRAMVNTLRQRLGPDADPRRCGGSTYRFEIWDGHPEAAAVEALLERLRTEMGELIEKVDAHDTPSGATRRRSMFYFGQSDGAQRV